MNENYYAERRKVSREMRRLAARRKMAIAAAVCCVILAIAILVISVSEMAEAQSFNEGYTDLPIEVVLIIDDDEPEENLDAHPVFGVVEVLKNIPQKQEETDTKPKYSEKELELLALVIYQEAGGDACSDETRRMVAEVALNRVDHPVYPNTLEKVLTQYGQYGRLYWTGIVWPQRAQYAAERHAVDRAYRIAEEVLTSDYRLLPGDMLFQAEFPQGTEIVAEQDGLYFCR